MEAVIESPGPESVWRILQEVSVSLQKTMQGLEKLRASQQETLRKSIFSWKTATT